MDQKEYDFGTRMCGDGREVVCSESMFQELTHQAIDLHPVGKKNCRAHMVSSASGISTLR
jgi:hypothetical protein